MKKIYKTLVLTSLFFITFLTSFCFININNRIVYAESSINETMSKEEIMEKYYELKEDNEELRKEYNDLNQKWADEKISIANKKFSVDDRVKTVEDRINMIEIHADARKKILIGVVTIFGISLWKMKKYIEVKVKKIAENMIQEEMNRQVPEEVSKQVGVEVDLIKKQIDDVKYEKWLKEEKKILVISKNNEEEKELKDSNLLKQFKKDYIKLGYESSNLSKYDVILFNDINGYFEDKEMKSIISRNRNDRAVYFYFNKRNLKNPDKNKMFKCEGNENTNFSKSNSTFCGNLLDLMRYQEDILKNKES